MASDDDPEARVARDIAEHGWHVALFPPEGRVAGWGHTIGLEERFAHPELLLFGRDLPLLLRLLNRLGAQVAAGPALRADEPLRGVVERVALELRPVSSKWILVFLGNAVWHAKRPDVAALQVFWPDPRGHFPWEPEADPDWRADQPLLFEEPTQRALGEAWIDSLRREGAL